MKYKFKTKPYKHQMDALELSWNKAMLYDRGKIDGASIIAPKGVISTWLNQEIPTHLPDHIEKVAVMWQANINKKQHEKLKSVMAQGHELHILIMNVEALSTEKGKDFATSF